MYNKILCLNFKGNELEKNHWKKIKKLSKELVLINEHNLSFAKHMKDTDCLLVKPGATVGEDIIDKAPQLKYVGMLGTGYGRIDAEYAAKKGIAVTNIAGYSTQGVAELLFGLLIERIRELERAKSQARKGDYSEATFQGQEIQGKIFGIIGLGRIGRRIADIAYNGFGARVSYWSKNRKKNYEKKSIHYKTINALLKESDFLSLNLAFTPETKHFLNKEKIQKIKSGAVIINLAPMDLVDINALTERLKKKDITFILDHSDELSEEEAKKLSQYKNCIMYPPIGYITKEATRAKLIMFVDNIENFLQGKPTNKINPAPTALRSGH